MVTYSTLQFRPITAVQAERLARREWPEGYGLELRLVLEPLVPIGGDARWHRAAPPWRTLGLTELFGHRALRTERGRPESVDPGTDGED